MLKAGERVLDAGETRAEGRIFRHPGLCQRALMGQLDRGELPDGDQITGTLDHQPDAGSFGVLRSLGDRGGYFRRQIDVLRGFDCSIAKDERDPETSPARREPDDRSFFELESKGPPGFDRIGIPLLDVDAVLFC